MTEELYKELYRPQFHFTPKKNWINDPNGLLYYDGEYHLFFQYNPNGLGFGEMAWGHAVGTDLVHWTQIEHALMADSWGRMFSGSAVVDWNNTAGFQTGKEKTLVAIYTCDRFADVDSSVEDQCIAYSNDRGRTWTKYSGNPVVPTPRLVNRGFRDPKVFWHAPTNKWVMIVYHCVGDALYGSPDLKHWKLLSEFTGLPHECPDMYEMPVDGDPNNTRWVTEGGNGDFFIGRFDGTTFTPETEKLTCDYGWNYYASQTFNDIPASDGRRIQIACMGGNFLNMPFNGQMSFPRELTLVTTPRGIRMVRRPVREIALIRGRERKWENLALAEKGSGTFFPSSADECARVSVEKVPDPFSELLEIQAKIALGSAGKVGLRVRDETIRYSAVDGRLRCLGKNAPLDVKDGLLDLHILLDRASIEIFADGGLVSMSSTFLPEVEDRGLELYAKGGTANVVSLSVWELKSMWR